MIKANPHIQTGLKAVTARVAILNLLLQEDLTEGMRGVLENTKICLDVLIERMNK